MFPAYQPVILQWVHWNLHTCIFGFMSTLVCVCASYLYVSVCPRCEPHLADRPRQPGGAQSMKTLKKKVREWTNPNTQFYDLYDSCFCLDWWMIKLSLFDSLEANHVRLQLNRLVFDQRLKKQSQIFPETLGYMAFKKHWIRPVRGKFKIISIYDKYIIIRISEEYRYLFRCFQVNGLIRGMKQHIWCIILWQLTTFCW